MSTELLNVFMLSWDTSVLLSLYDQEPSKDQLVNLLIQTHRLRHSEMRSIVSIDEYEDQMRCNIMCKQLVTHQTKSPGRRPRKKLTDLKSFSFVFTQNLRAVMSQVSRWFSVKSHNGGRQGMVVGDDPSSGNSHP